MTAPTPARARARPGWHAAAHRGGAARRHARRAARRADAARRATRWSRPRRARCATALDEARAQRHARRRRRWASPRPGPLDPVRRACSSTRPTSIAGCGASRLAPTLGDGSSASPAFLERDTQVAALAEGEFGAARGVADYVYLTVSTGIGGGVVIDGTADARPGRTRRRARPPDGRHDGPVCGCGARGHLEAISSGTGIARAAARAAAWATSARRRSPRSRTPVTRRRPRSWTTRGAPSPRRSSAIVDVFNPSRGRRRRRHRHRPGRSAAAARARSRGAAGFSAPGRARRDRSGAAWRRRRARSAPCRWSDLPASAKIGPELRPNRGGPMWHLCRWPRIARSEEANKVDDAAPVRRLALRPAARGQIGGTPQMAVRVGINGFGRIGRQSLKAIIERTQNVEVVAINDLVDTEMNALLFRYDSTYGRYPGTRRPHRRLAHRRRPRDQGLQGEGPGRDQVGRRGRRHRDRVDRPVHRRGQGRGPPPGRRQEGHHQRPGQGRGRDHRARRQRGDVRPGQAHDHQQRAAARRTASRRWPRWSTTSSASCAA